MACVCASRGALRTWRLPRISATACRTAFRCTGCVHDRSVEFSPRDNAFGQSLADLAAIALSMSDVNIRSGAATIAAQHILASRTTIEQAGGVIAELDQVDIDSGMQALAARAQDRGMTVAHYSEHVVEDLELR